MADPNANADAPNGEIEIVIDPGLDPEAKILALEEANKKLFARTKKAEGFVQDADGKWIKKPAAPAPITTKEETNKPYNILEDEVADLILDGYTKDDVRFIMANGGRTALKDENSYLAIAINTKREQRRAEQAAAQTTNGGGTEIERKYTPEQLKNMSSKELEKILPHAS
jgi:hypothetical protein